MRTHDRIGSDKRARVGAALAGTPLDPTRLRASAQATSIGKARQAAVRAGLPAINGERALVLHRKRAELACVEDPLAKRSAGSFARAWERTMLVEAYTVARYRQATHAHEELLSVGAAHTYVHSSSDRLDPRQAGLPNAYARKAYSVAASRHEIAAPVGWLRAVYVRGAAVIDGRLVLELAPEADPGGAYAATWVERGRGTALRTEHGFVERRGDKGWAITRRRRRAA
jgi:hypothetical protein